MRKWRSWVVSTGSPSSLESARRAIWSRVMGLGLPAPFLKFKYGSLYVEHVGQDSAQTQILET